MTTINFNRENTKDFIRIYNKAIREGEDSFVFQDGDFVTKYAYYVIQHLVNSKMVKGEFNKKNHFLIKNNPN